MENLTNKDWSNLPVHKPDVDLWDRIDTELDLQGVSANLDQLPKYSPKMGLWKTISLKLAFYQYIKYLYFAAATGITASVLFFIFSNTPETNMIKKNKEEVKVIQQNTEVNNIQQTQQQIVENSNNILNNKNNTAIYNTTKKENQNIIKTRSALTKDFTKSTASKQDILHDKSQNSSSNNINTLSSKINKSENNDNKPTTVLNPVAEKTQNTQILFINNEAISAKPNEVENKVQIAENRENKIDETLGIEPKKVNLKSTQKPHQKGFSYVGVDYTILKIYNKESFSYTYNQLIHQFGISYQYNYSNYLLQTGLSYSKFTDNQAGKVHFQLDQHTKYNYVDSVVFNSQGEIIQYITHPVVFNDSVLYQEYIPARKTYTLLNIPVLAGYQWNLSKFGFAVKSGFLCTMIITEKTSMILPVTQNIKALKTEPFQSSIKGLNWAAVVSASASYNLSKQWGINVEPIVYYYFKPMYNNMDIYPDFGNKSPWLFGLKTGIYYKF